MILLVIGSLVTACLALLQGIHTIRTGTMQPFFDQSRDIPPYLTAAATVAYGMVYCLPSMALLAILAFSLSRNLRRATAWLGGHVGELAVISNDVVHSRLLGKNGRYHTTCSIREGAPSEASS